MEILRLDEFREGKVGFVSARVSQEIIIDIRPTKSEDAVTPNMDHFCLVLGPTDMDKLYEELKAKGIHMEGDVHAAWGTQGMGQQFKIWDPEGVKIELRCYSWAP